MRKHLGLNEALLNGALVPETLPSFFMHALVPLTGLVGAGFAANSVSDYFQILEQKQVAPPLAWLLAHPMPPVMEPQAERGHARRDDDGPEAVQGPTDDLLNFLARIHRSRGQLPTDPAPVDADQHRTDGSMSAALQGPPPQHQDQQPAGPPRPITLLPHDSESLWSLIHNPAMPQAQGQPLADMPLLDAEPQHGMNRLLSFLAGESSSQNQAGLLADPTHAER